MILFNVSLLELTLTMATLFLFYFSYPKLTFYFRLAIEHMELTTEFHKLSIGDKRSKMSQPNLTEETFLVSKLKK